MLRVGILGGGQLGRMLIQAAIDLDLRVKVLDSAPDSPCAGIAHEFVVGSVRSPAEVVRFAADVQLLTLELEAVSVEGLRQIEAQGVRVAPAPSLVELLQDKGRQRSWYAQEGFPGPQFQLWQPGDPVELPFPLIQKALQGGYDGRGVQRVTSPDALWPQPSLLEAEVSIAKELSVIVARSVRGEIKAFPPGGGGVSSCCACSGVSAHTGRGVPCRRAGSPSPRRSVGRALTSSRAPGSGTLLHHRWAPLHQRVSTPPTQYWACDSKSLLDQPV